MLLHASLRLLLGSIVCFTILSVAWQHQDVPWYLSSIVAFLSHNGNVGGYFRVQRPRRTRRLDSLYGESVYEHDGIEDGSNPVATSPQQKAHSKETQSNNNNINNNNNNPATLSLGDLPGYSGWGRPSKSTASWYNYTLPNDGPQVGMPWQMDLTCIVVQCQNLQAVFYVRAYGSSVLTASVKRIAEGKNPTKYTATFVFFAPGEHVVEAILTFSHVPAIEEFPSDNEPLYEGYLLPQMPVTIAVQADPRLAGLAQETSRPLCELNDLYENSTTSALQRGSFIVKSNVRSAPSVSLPSQTYSFEDYKQGTSSLGIRMEYESQCNIPSLSDLKSLMLGLEWIDDLHILLVGDSNFVAQQKLMFSTFGIGLRTTLIKTHDSLSVRLAEIQEKLIEVAKRSKPSERFFILFNAGLHDIARLCSSRTIHSRSQTINVSDDAFSCFEEYQKNVEDFVGLIKAFPANLVVWQTTTAGWLKWGNYGFAWPPDRGQEYPLDSHACHLFNEAAWEILQHHNVPVMDAYWLTLSRPDHREIDILSRRGKKLVHAGVEIYNVLVRKWLWAILLSSTKSNSD